MYAYPDLEKGGYGTIHDLENFDSNNSRTSYYESSHMTKHENDLNYSRASSYRNNSQEETQNICCNSTSENAQLYHENAVKINAAFKVCLVSIIMAFLIIAIYLEIIYLNQK